MFEKVQLEELDLLCKKDSILPANIVEVGSELVSRFLMSNVFIQSVCQSQSVFLSHLFIVHYAVDEAAKRI